jgi:hypothetical protein
VQPCIIASACCVCFFFVGFAQLQHSRREDLGDQHRLRAKPKVRATRPQAACLHFWSSCRAPSAGANSVWRSSSRLKLILPRLKPGCEKSSAPSEPLPRRASQTCSGPRGRYGKTVCAKTTHCSSQSKATSRTHARTPGSIPSSRASSAVGRPRPWRSTRTAKRPLRLDACGQRATVTQPGDESDVVRRAQQAAAPRPLGCLAVEHVASFAYCESRASDSRNALLPLREKGREKRGAVMTFMIWGISTCHDRYCGRGDLSIPAMRVPGLIPLLANQSRFISSA